MSARGTERRAEQQRERAERASRESEQSDERRIEVDEDGTRHEVLYVNGRRRRR
jgi:hypothetical protein